MLGDSRNDGQPAARYRRRGAEIKRTRSCAKREFSQKHLVVAVGDKTLKRCCRLEAVAAIEAQRPVIERRGTNPEIARSELHRLSLEPAHESCAEAAALERRQKREELEIGSLEPGKTHRHRPRLDAVHLDEIA